MHLPLLSSVSTLLLIAGLLPGAFSLEVKTKKFDIQLYDCQFTDDCKSITIPERYTPIDVSCTHWDSFEGQWLKTTEDGRFVRERDIITPKETHFFGFIETASFQYDNLPQCSLAIKTYSERTLGLGKMVPGLQRSTPGECLPLPPSDRNPVTFIEIDTDNMMAQDVTVFCALYEDDLCDDELAEYRFGGFGEERTLFAHFPADEQVVRYACF